MYRLILPFLSVVFLCYELRKNPPRVGERRSGLCGKTTVLVA